MPKRKSKYQVINTDSPKKSTVKILLAILALLVVWFLLWLYDWKDELLALFKKKSSTPKSTTSSTSSTTGGDKLIFNTIVKEVSTASDVRYVHRQDDAALLWSINHNLGAITNVQVLSLTGEVIFADVQNNIEWYDDPITGNGGWIANTTNISFSEAKAGFAIFT